MLDLQNGRMLKIIGCATGSVKQVFSLESGADGKPECLSRFLKAKIRGQSGKRLLKREIACRPRREHGAGNGAGRLYQRVQPQWIVCVINLERLLNDWQHHLQGKPGRETGNIIGPGDGLQVGTETDRKTS